MLYMHMLGKLEMFIRFPAAFLGFTKSLLLMNASDCLPDLLPTYASAESKNTWLDRKEREGGRLLAVWIKRG